MPCLLWADWLIDECLQRMGLGTPNVSATVGQLLKAGVEFLVPKDPDDKNKGALIRTQMGSVTFELVHDDRVA